MILEEETYKRFGYYSGDLSPKSNKKIVCACDECGKIREIPKYGYCALCSFCSRKGERNPAWKGGLIKCTCQECGKVFEVTQYRIKEGGVNFCSKKCKGISQSKTQMGKNSPGWKGGKIERTCEICGNSFEVFPSQIKKGEGKFCSVICYKKAPQKRKPTKPELIFQDICKRNNLPFHFVGNNILKIGKKGRKQLNPDFIESNGKKILVEVFGDYWHSPLLNYKLREDATRDYRKKHFRHYKWHPIFIWESDLKRKDAEVFVLNTLKREKVI